MNKLSDSLHKIIYNIDASHIDLKNMNVDIFIPENENEIKDIINDAISNNKEIIIRGAGTNLVGNCLPVDNCYVLDLSKINNIYKIENNSITIDPGVILDELNIFLNKSNLFFPVVPGSHAAAQIGSMIATNASGMRAVKYGKMEQWINWISVLVVDKNNFIQELRLSGSDIKDFLNSEGTLGIITKINLKIIKKPTEISLSFFKFNNIDDLILKTSEITEKKNILNVSAIEFIDKIVAKFLNLEEGYYLLVEFENSNGEIKDNDEINKIWNIRDSCYSVVVSNGYELIEDPQLGLNKIKDLILWFEKNNIPTFGHIGTGILHPHYKKAQNELISEMYNIVKNLGGTVSGEHGIGIKKKIFINSDYKTSIINLKTKYNPNDIFGGNNIV